MNRGTVERVLTIFVGNQLGSRVSQFEDSRKVYIYIYVCIVLRKEAYRENVIGRWMKRLILGVVKIR